MGAYITFYCKTIDVENGFEYQIIECITDDGVTSERTLATATNKGDANTIVAALQLTQSMKQIAKNHNSALGLKLI